MDDMHSLFKTIFLLCVKCLRMLWIIIIIKKSSKCEFLISSIYCIPACVKIKQGESSMERWTGSYCKINLDIRYITPPLVPKYLLNFWSWLIQIFLIHLQSSGMHSKTGMSSIGFFDRRLLLLPALPCAGSWFLFPFHNCLLSPLYCSCLFNNKWHWRTRGNYF